MMSGIDGFEVCRRMLSNERTRDIPIIFLTAKGQFEDELRGYEEGAFDYITKPFHPLSLAPTIHEALDLARQHTLERSAARRIEKLRNLLNCVTMVIRGHRQQRHNPANEHGGRHGAALVEDIGVLVPPRLNSIEDSGLDASFLSELLLKHSTSMVCWPARPSHRVCASPIISLSRCCSIS